MGWQDAPEVERKPAWQSAPVVKRERDNPRSKSYSGSDLATSKFTMGLSDKVAAATRAGSNYIGNLISGKSQARMVDVVSGADTSFGAQYDRELADEKGARAKYQAEHPVLDYATSPLNFLGGGKVVGTALSAVRAGIVNGAVVGAAAGAGNSEGTPGQQAGQIAFSSGAGALTGGVASRYVPTILAGGSKITSRVADSVRPHLERVGEVIRPRAPLVEKAAGDGLQSAVPPPQSVHKAAPTPRQQVPARLSRSQQLINDALEADGNTPRRAGKIIDEARGRGVPLAIMDTGDNARGLAASVGRQPGASRTLVRDAAISRQEAQTERVQSAVARDLGRTANRHEQSRALLQTARDAARPLYEEAYAQPVRLGEDMADLLRRPSMKSALGNAKSIAAEEGRDPTALGFVDLPDGTVDLPEAPTMQTLDYVKRGLDDVLEKYRDKTTGKLVLDTQGNAVEGTRRALVETLDTMNPAYAKARAAYAGPVRANAAMIKGRSALNKSADDITAEVDGLTPFELDHYKLGLRSAISEGIEGRVDGADKVRFLTGTPKKRAALARIFGGTKGFDNFVATLADEARTSATYGRVNTGSQTAYNLADDAATNDTGLAGIAGKAVGAKITGGATLPTLLRALADARKYGVGEAGKVTRAEVGAAIAETDPVVLAEALRAAQRSRAFDRLAARRAAGSGRGAATASGSAGGYIAELVRGGQ